MTQPDPRQQMRDLIAIRLHAVECGCETYRRDGSDADDPLYTHMADAVMELFPEAEREGRLSWSLRWWPWSEKRNESWAESRYVLRTAPESAKEPA